MTINDVIRGLGRAHPIPMLTPPKYSDPNIPLNSSYNLALVHEGMAHHATDEGWELALGLQDNDYALFGYKVGDNLTNVADILKLFPNPTTVFVQDKREWDGLTAGTAHDPRYRFTNITLLKHRPDIFKVTVIKDAHHRREYHRDSAEEIGCHAWVTYYHPRIIHHLAPYTRPAHIIRTYHTVNPANVPAYTPHNRQKCVISGAIQSKVYPLRTTLSVQAHKIPGLTVLPHPGYTTPGPFTPQYLRDLSKYRVSICTTSIYGYSLRKLIESTACGCIVLTNLPEDDIIPEIDGNLIRIPPITPLSTIATIVDQLATHYDPHKQEYYANKALSFYSYQQTCARLTQDIDSLRLNYNL